MKKENINGFIHTIVKIVCQMIVIAIPLSAFATEEDEEYKGWWDGDYYWLEAEPDSWDNNLYYTRWEEDSVMLVSPTRYSEDNADGGYYHGVLRVPEKANVFNIESGGTVVAVNDLYRNGVTELYLPPTIKTIYNTVTKCYLLTKVSIAGSPVFDNCFNECPAIVEFESHSKVPPTFGENCFNQTDLSKCVLSVPEESIEAYKEAEGWNQFGTVKALVSSGVETVTMAKPETDAIYDLFGRKVNAPVKGQLYISNGQKIIYGKYSN